MMKGTPLFAGRFALVAVLLTVVSVTVAQSVLMDENDRQKLVQVLSSFTTLPTGWSIADSSNACQWQNIGCDGAGRLIEFVVIKSSGANVSATISPVLAEFPALRRIRISEVNAFGTIPPQIFTPQLTNLELALNYLNGSIPETISNSPNLVTLALGGNALTGTIPSSIANLNSLDSLSVYGNRFSCPIPVSVYTTMSNRASNFTNCRLENMNFDSAKNGTFCGGTLQLIDGPTRCVVFPTPFVRNVRPLIPDQSIDLPNMRIETHGPTIAFFAKFSNGTVFKNEYATASIQAVQLYDVVSHNPPDRPDVRLWESLPVKSYTVLTNSTPGQFELTTYFTNRRIRELTIIFFTNHSSNPGGLKYSARVRGQDDIFEGRSRPGAIGLPLIFETKGPFFAPNDILNCEYSQNLVVGSNECFSDRYRSSLTATISDPPTLSWVHNSSNIFMSLDYPFSFENENGTRLTVYGLRESFQIVGVAPVYGLYNPYLPIDRINVPPEYQGLAVGYELLFKGLRSELYWDPNLSLLLLNDNEPAPTTNKSPEGTTINEAAAINLAAAIAVPVVVVAVIAIVALFLAVPKVRGFFVPASVASREIRKRMAASAAMDQPQFQPPASKPTSDASGAKNKRWTVGQVPPTDV